MTLLPIKLALVDDHKLFRKGLQNLIEVACNGETTIVFEASNGKDMQEQIDPANLPDIVLMDINMPGMNGFECVYWLSFNYSMVKILVISMIQTEESIVQMLKLGVKGYLSKDVEPKELGDAIRAIYNKGYYYTDFITGQLIHSLNHDHIDERTEYVKSLSERELAFLRYACSELTYSEIAAEMYLSPKTIDGYRKTLFEKLRIKNRVGLALFAVKHGLVTL